MRNPLLWFMLLLCTFNTQAQVITGKVYREGTDSLIAGASVYYSRSMTGTTTDKSGRFKLPVKDQQIPITVSNVGYYSATVHPKNGQPLVVFLKPKTEELYTVTVHADGMERDKEVQLFTREFIGNSEYAKSCVITNIDDVYLFYSKRTKTLSASSDKPIIIENKKLGYTISCYLDNFERTPGEVHFSGNYIFKENKAANARDLAKIKRNREDAYDGSRMEFIRALWSRNLKRTEFNLYTPAPEYLPLRENDIAVIDSTGQKYMRLPDKIYIVNNRDSRRISTLSSTEELSFIDKDGYYSSGLQWTGALGSQRIGDLLPFEYQTEKDTRLLPQIAAAPAPFAPADKFKSLIFEKAYLHTDRDVYARGDTMWFKAYLVNALDYKPISNSGNLYVELLPPDSARILSREIIRMDNGLGKGDMELADSLSSGKYRLRAYTNWMRNFGDNFVFEKNITILNAQAIPDAPDPKATAKNANKKAGPLTITAPTPVITATIAPSINQLPVVRFYPEGGSLVEGISARVAVKAEDGYGKGIPVTGAVLSSPTDTIARFSCDSLGMGLFVLRPVSGRAYHAVVKLTAPANAPTGGRQDNLAFELPSVLSKGLTLQIRQTDSVIQALVNTTDTAGKVKPNCFIVIKHAGKTFLTQQLQLQHAQTSYKISGANLPEGISAITIYNSSGKPECERLVYIHHANNSAKAGITTNKRVYAPKEQVTASITAQPNSSLSMAVVDAGLVPEQADNIISYLRLQSDIRGNIEYAGRYFDTTNTSRFKQLDLLLLTQGWRDFIWRRLADTAIRISYAGENGINVSGRVRDEVLNKMMPNLNISLYANGVKGNKLFTSQTDSLGRFNFPGLMFYDKQNIKLTALNGKGEKKGSFMVDTILPLPVKPPIGKPKDLYNPVDSAATAAVEKRAGVITASKVFKVTKLKEVNIKGRQNVILNNGSVLTSWGPDQIFNITPADYQYNTLEWFLQQNTKGAIKPVNDPNRLIAPGLPPPSNDVRIQEEYNRKVREYMRPLSGLAYMGQDTFFYKMPGSTQDSYGWRTKSKPIPPNIIVNGKELDMDNYEQAEAYRTIYFSMPMNKFKKVVLRHMTGTLHSSIPPILPVVENSMSSNSWAQVGTIAVDRYLLYLTLNDDAMIDNPGALSTDADGYYQARNFYEPKPNDKPSLADYRSTIYWAPDIKTDAAGKATVNFYNALLQTNVRIIVQGITDTGTPLIATGMYEVQ